MPKNPKPEKDLTTIKAGEPVYSAADAQKTGREILAAMDATITLTEAIHALFPLLGIEDEKEVQEITITWQGNVRVFRTDRSVRTHRFPKLEREVRQWAR